MTIKSMGVANCSTLQQSVDQLQLSCCAAIAGLLQLAAGSDRIRAEAMARPGLLPLCTLMLQHAAQYRQSLLSGSWWSLPSLAPAATFVQATAL
jgi:hypothetical protein